MIKYALIAVALAVVLVFAASANAQVCITPSQTVENLNQMATDNDFEHELFVYKDKQAKNIKDFIEKKIQQETYDFDTVIIARRENNPMAYIAIFKDGCQVANGVIPAAEYFEVKVIGDGV